MSKTINIMIGLPGCGRSTFCKNIIDEGDPNDVWVSIDTYRNKYLKETDSYFSKDIQAMNDFIGYINYLLQKDEDLNIYLDAPHLTKDARLRTLSRIKLNGDEEICYYFFDTQLGTCISRNRKREDRTPPEGAMRELNKQAQMEIMAIEEETFFPMEIHVDSSGRMNV